MNVPVYSRAPEGLVYITIPGLEWMRWGSTAGGNDKEVINLATSYVANVVKGLNLLFLESCCKSVLKVSNDVTSKKTPGFDMSLLRC